MLNINNYANVKFLVNDIPIQIRNIPTNKGCISHMNILKFFDLSEKKLALIIHLFFSLLCCFSLLRAEVTSIACIGNSITTGWTTNGDIEAYPAKLSVLLGPNYTVFSAGVSGTYMQKQCNPSYWTSGMLSTVFALHPNIITISLGTNDSRVQTWNSVGFITDYLAMVDTLLQIIPRPQILLCFPLPAWQVNGQWPYNGINGDIILDSVIPAIRQISNLKGLSTIDLYTPFESMQQLVPDGVHPNENGQDTIAHIIYHTILSIPSVQMNAHVSNRHNNKIYCSRNKIVTIKTCFSGICEMRIIIPNGKICKTIIVDKPAFFKFSINGLQNGVYLFSIFCRNETFSQMVLLY